jgi:hypothetical protein
MVSEERVERGRSLGRIEGLFGGLGMGAFEKEGPQPEPPLNVGRSGAGFA